MVIALLNVTRAAIVLLVQAPTLVQLAKQGIGKTLPQTYVVHHFAKLVVQYVHHPTHAKLATTASI